jgi:hypothetical protein
VRRGVNQERTIAPPNLLGINLWFSQNRGTPTATWSVRHTKVCGDFKNLL